MKNKSLALVGAIGLAVGAFGIAFVMIRPVDKSMLPPPTAGISRSELDLRQKMRAVWNDHVAWSRSSLISIADHHPDEGSTSARLLKNQADIGEVMQIFYGKKTGSRLTVLLKEHIVIAGDFVKQSLSKNAQGQRAAEQRFAENGEAIAAWMAAANPYWGKETMERMMADHVKVFKEECAARIAKRYEEEIAKSDEMFKQAMVMADHFSEGIVQQFPEKFTMDSLSSCS